MLRSTRPQRLSPVQPPSSLAAWTKPSGMQQLCGSNPEAAAVPRRCRTSHSRSPLFRMRWRRFLSEVLSGHVRYAANHPAALKKRARMQSQHLVPLPSWPLSLRSVHHQTGQVRENPVSVSAC